MNAKQLELRMNRIFEQVYGLNESLSNENLILLQEGFEDGIREGFLGNMKRKIKGAVGTAVGNTIKKGREVVAKGKEAVNGAVEKGKEYYNKGKELANQAWKDVNTFITDTKTKIKDGIGAATKLIVSNYNEYKGKITTVYNTAISDLSTAYKELKEKSEELSKAVLGSMTAIKDSLKTQKDKFVNYFTENKDKFKKYIKENYDSFMKSAKSALSSADEKVKATAKNVENYLIKFSKKSLEITGEVIKGIFLISVGSIAYLFIGLQKMGEAAYKVGREELSDLFDSTDTSYTDAKNAALEKFKYLKTFESFKNNL
jgi:hypothetical protein